MEYAVLNTGAKMPMIGFGVFQIPEGDCKRVVLDAIRAGYRSFDTAASYMNEKALGEAVREAIETGLVTREELFITSKMWVQDMKNYDMAEKAIETSLSNLGLEYLDLYLLHQAMGNYFEAYRAMEDAYAEGKLKAIGVSNFFPHVLVNFCETVKVIPAVNQVELHPFFAQNTALEVMREYGVQPAAWAPLAEGKFNIFTNPVLGEIAAAHNCTTAQVVLAWNVCRGVVILPKSTKPSRMAENLSVLDIHLSENEMKTISELSLDHSEIINHSDPELVKLLNRRNIHD
ncbi:MAG: aldo/keto reductase [Bulleidia sp.]